MKMHSLCQYKYLIDSFAYNWTKNGFMVYYLIKSIRFNSNIRVVTFINRNFNSGLLSLHNLFLNSCWIERELFELSSINYFNILDSRRLVTDYGFTGNPLVKKFPVIGFVETFYSKDSTSIVSLAVNNFQFSKQINVFMFDQVFNSK
jgi:NADH-quinone oxidoreductase subunit C